MNVVTPTGLTGIEADSRAEIAVTPVWGVPFSRVSEREALTEIDRLVAARRPRFVITANLHYVMLAAGDPQLRSNNDRAAMILADGMPIVWASRWRDGPLPERVTGSDLVPKLCARAAERGHRVFFLGAAPGVAEAAARKLCIKHPTLSVAGTLAPPYRELTRGEWEKVAAEIRAAQPDLLFVAFGQPKGEYWVADWHEATGAAVTIQVGATLDFIAENVRRAPRWMRRFGLEWLFRFANEPRRLAGRYAANAWFATRMLAQDAITPRSRRA